MARLQKIDQLTLRSHHWLQQSDECYFLHTYEAEKGFRHSESNQLIFNLKKGMEKHQTSSWRYKGVAIRQVARELSVVLAEWPKDLVYVPIPPSKIRSDKGYDDRLVKILKAVDVGSSLNIRELLEQCESTPAAHLLDGQRLNPIQLKANYQLVQEGLDPEPSGIVIFDDVLTAGAHYRACHEILKDHFTSVPIYGLFAARSNH